MKKGRAPFISSVLATNREVKEAALLSPLGFGHKPRGEGRPRSFASSVLAINREVKKRPLAFHSSVLATNRDMKEGRAPFPFRFWPGKRRKVAFLSPLGFRHKSRGRKAVLLSSLGFGHKPGGEDSYRDPCSHRNKFWNHPLPPPSRPIQKRNQVFSTFALTLE